MNPRIGWTLAVLAVAAGYASYGWPGVVLAVSVIVFWLLLQFSRTLRVMRNAGQSPVGHVESAVMFATKLRAGMRLIDVVVLTRSLGQRVSETPEVWRWADAGGTAVVLTFDAARLARWAIERPDERPDQPAAS